MRIKKEPEIRFPGFVEEWVERKLEHVATYRNGKAHEKDISDNGKFIVINSKFVSTNGKIKKYAHKQIEPMVANEIAFVLSDVPNGRALARTFLVEEDNKYTLNQRIAGITPHLNTNSYFLNNLLNRHHYFLRFDDGVGQTNLSKKDVENFSDKYPSKNEQSKIGSFFRELNQTIVLHQQELTTLKQTKQGFLQKMFPKEGESVPEVRFPGFTGNWEECMLQDLAVFSKGDGYSKSDLTEKGIPVILYGRLYTKYESIIESVDTFATEKVKSVKSTGNEVIVPSSGETSEDIARASAVIKPGIILGGDLNIIRPNNQIDSKFLAIAISNGKQQKELIKRAQGKSVVHLHNSDLKKVNLLFPEKEEQIKIASFFKHLDDKIALHERELNTLKETKKAFLQKMFV